MARSRHFLAPPELLPFRNAVPCWDDVASAARDLQDALAEGRDPLADAAAHPGRHRWLATTGRVTADDGLFAVRVEGDAHEPRIPAGSHVILRLDPALPRDGQMVLVAGIADPASDGGAVLRHWRLERRRRRPPRLRLEAPNAAPIVLEQPGEHLVHVLARFVDLAE